jgi:hypothetical protein
MSSTRPPSLDSDPFSSSPHNISSPSTSPSRDRKHDTIYSIISSYTYSSAPPAYPLSNIDAAASPFTYPPLPPSLPPSSLAQARGVHFPRDSRLEEHIAPSRWTLELPPPSPAYREKVEEEVWEAVDASESTTGRRTEVEWEVPVSWRDPAFLQKVEEAREATDRKSKGDFSREVGVDEHKTKRRFVSFSAGSPYLPFSRLIVFGLSRSSLHVRLLVVLPALVLLSASLILLLLVLLSPVLGRSSGLKTLGLLNLQTSDGSKVVLGPLGSLFFLSVVSTRAHLLIRAGVCYPSSANSTQHYTCTSASLTPTFTALYSSLSLPSASTSTLPLSFPLFPTALLLVIVLLTLSAVPLLATTFPASPTSSFARQRRILVVTSAACLATAFVLGLSASLAQWATLRKVVEAAAEEADAEVGKVELGRAWTLIWVAMGLVGAAGVVEGLCYGLVAKEGGVEMADASERV